jgi:hypothetical protein
MRMIVLFFLFTAAAFSQYYGGAAYQVKSSVPDKGAAVYLIRKLPYQSPSIGLNLKGKLSYYFSDEKYERNSFFMTADFNEYSVDVFIESNFFFGIFNPFAALGAGGGYISSEDISKGFFALSGQAGIKFLYTLQPFVEVQIRNGFSDFSRTEGVKIKKLQVSAALGVIFQI